ncbi:hypothetical protein D9M72_579840 [compost metagenome]
MNSIIASRARPKVMMMVVCMASSILAIVIASSLLWRLCSCRPGSRKSVGLFAGKPAPTGSAVFTGFVYDTGTVGAGLPAKGPFQSIQKLADQRKNGTSPNTVARCITRRAGR